jgi:hypothetical protein
MDGSTYVPTHSSIIIRPNVTVSPSAMMSDLKVTGAASGLHTGSIVQSDDKRTLVFIPSEPFNLGEKVTVVIQNNSSTSVGAAIQPISFSFNVSPSEPAPDFGQAPFLGYPNKFLGMSTDTIIPPPGFPQMRVVASNNPTPGYIFLTTFSDSTVAGTPYRAVIDSLGQILYIAAPSNAPDWDFKVLPNGKVAFCEGGYSEANPDVIVPTTKYYIMDSSFTIVDTFNAISVSPYTTDFHDIEILPNGHALMLCQYTINNYNMSKDVIGGQANATFVTNAVIEVDRSINQPVWVWRCWDPGHYSDTDATNDPLTESTIDALHANAVFIDTTDGNLLLSARSMDEITKINRADTGSIMWRLGGKHNQFTFINDSIKFSHQHAIRRIPNGHYTLFDNGNYGHIISRADTLIFGTDPGDTEIDVLSVKYARACEYDIDTVHMTANLVWHYDRDSTVQSEAMGYVQRFANGNTLINWGLNTGPAGVTDQPAVTEVDSNGNLAFELHINTPYVVYRAEKFPWNFSTSSVSAAQPSQNNIALGEPFPNPASGVAHVVIGAPPYEAIHLELYDALGRAIRSYYDGLAGGPVMPLEIDTKGLPAGAYRLVLSDNEGSISRQFIVLP